MKPTLNFERAQQYMQRNNLDALLATSKRNVSYFSDAPIASLTSYKMGDNGIPYRAAAAMFSGEEDIPHWFNSGRIRAAGGRPHYFETWEDIADELKRRGLQTGRIGVEEMHLSHSDYTALKGFLPEADLVDASWVFFEIRMVKTPAEIRLLREINDITGRALVKAYDAIGDGVPLRKLLKVFQDTVEAGGAVFPPYCAATHTRTTRIEADGNPVRYDLFSHPDVTIKKGDLVQMDMVAELEYYYSDLCRMACCGEPDDTYTEMWNVSIQVQRAMLEAVKPGIKGSELYAIGAAASKARPYYEFSDLTKPVAVYGSEVLREDRYFFHNVSLGHGIGREVHEPPYITPAFLPEIPDPPFEPNMVIAVESSHTSWAIFNIEDTILVTDDGYEFLTSIDRDIYVR